MCALVPRENSINNGTSIVRQKSEEQWKDDSLTDWLKEELSRNAIVVYIVINTKKEAA